LRVAIDGPDAAGKTTFADDLAALVGPRRPVIRLSIDRFHHPEAVRRRRGSLSAEGFYHDSFDHAAVVDGVLRPLGPGGDGWYRPGAFDYRSDNETVVAPEFAPPGAALLFDGVFLLRPELRDFWDVSVYLHADPMVTLARARIRDLAVFGSVEVIEERYRRRYLPGQELYRADAGPAERADIVLNMKDPVAPVIVRWGSQRPLGGATVASG
jgi:uridine kinase